MEVRLLNAVESADDHLKLKTVNLPSYFYRIPTVGYAWCLAIA